MTGLVTVFRDKFVQGFPDHPDAEPCERGNHLPGHTIGECARGIVGPLGGPDGALSHTFESDAHFCPYRSQNSRRLNKGAPDAGVPVVMTFEVYDFDAPSHSGGEPASDDWRHDWREKLARLWQEHPSFYAYESRGGGRVLYQLETPKIIRTPEDALGWRRFYAITCAYFRRRFGLEADEACSDVTRLFRLPDVVRDGERQQWPSWGAESDKVGSLIITATEADRDAAKVLVPTAFSMPRKRKYYKRTQRGSVQSPGLLYYALLARGELVGRRDDDSCVILCPNRAEHSKDTDGTDSTVLYFPGPLDAVGWILCRHRHCREKSAGQWLPYFSSGELEEARQRMPASCIDMQALLAAHRVSP